MDLFFWGLMLVPFGVALAASEYESITAGALALIIAGLIVYSKTGVEPLYWALTNWLTVLLYLGGYVFAGAIYATVKWWWVVEKSTSRIQHDYNEYKKAFPNTSTVENFKTSSYNSVKASLNKMRITGWMVWWPPSLVWSITHDLFTEIWNWVYNMFVNLFDKIAGHKIDRTLG
jgi:hypothetical protein